MKTITLKNGFNGYVDVLPEDVKLNTIYRDQRGNLLWFMKDMNRNIYVNYEMIDSNSYLRGMDPESVELLIVEFEKETVWVSGYENNLPSKKSVIKGQYREGYDGKPIRLVEQWCGFGEVHEIYMNSVKEKDNGKFRIQTLNLCIDESDFPELVWGNLTEEECKKLGIDTKFRFWYRILYGVYTKNPIRTFTICCELSGATHIMVREVHQQSPEFTTLKENSAEVFSTSDFDSQGNPCRLIIYSIDKLA